ncbi:glycosyltransferase [Planktothrix sp. FACHB-1365]|uniref:glycosyltransferase family 2 protein n=1 Tax=Planktothrix sp. FACHB-1365 TaxID=2692855 RepID=UPI0016892306|nr:glycosyltransferase [Planktothrix sp. FACHB-1365]MBD2480934.1 glycosyltransferase family 2 protein [Planktothrix sp. FACHB-1365]
MIYWITVNYYSTELIQRLIDSIVETLHATSLQGINYQVIIINNSTDDVSIHQLKSPSILVLNAAENIGFGRACNLGLNWVYQQNDQAIVWLINPDAIVPKNSLTKATQFFEQNSHISLLGTVVYNFQNEVEFGGGEFIPETGKIAELKIISKELQTQSYVLVDWVSGCSLLINLKNFKYCPQFDQDYFLYYEDFDFCRRYAQQGHLIALTHQLQVIHQSSSITGKNPSLKIQQSIYSYLLTLEKHTSKQVLLYRLFRITVVAIFSLVKDPKVSLSKLKGVCLYWKRLVK